jgi:hypothetical protein
MGFMVLPWTTYPAGSPAVCSVRVAGAALETDTDPTGCRSPARCGQPGAPPPPAPAFPPQALDAAHARACGEIMRELLPPRRKRAAARVVKRKMSGYGVKLPATATGPSPAAGLKTP